MWNLQREAKLVYSFFCLLSLCAIASSILLYEDLVGPSLSAGHTKRVASYYCEPASPPKAEPAPSEQGGGGPALDLAPETLAAPQVTGSLIVPISWRKLLEVTHFHLFTVPVFLLIVSHLFMLGGFSSRAKVVWIGLGWGSGTLHIFAPFLVRLVPALSFVFPLSGGLLLVGSVVLTVHPLFGMWRRPRGKE